MFKGSYYVNVLELVWGREFPNEIIVLISPIVIGDEKINI